MILNIFFQKGDFYVYSCVYSNPISRKLDSTASSYLNLFLFLYQIYYILKFLSTEVLKWVE